MSNSPYQQQVVAKQSSSTFWLGVLVIVLIGFIYADQSGMIDRWNQPNDQTIVDPVPNDNEQSAAKVKLSDTYIVRVFETEAGKQPVWLTKLLDDDAFWLGWAKGESKMNFHTFDPGSPDEPNTQAESFLAVAAKNNIKAPFWIHAATGGKVLSNQPFSESVGTDGMKKIILSRAQ